IHNPMTAAIGDSEDMRKAIQLLDEVKESIINSYEIKTGLSRARLSHLMDNETWMNAKKALDLGFCDEILYQHEDEKPAEPAAYTFSPRWTNQTLMNKLIDHTKPNEDTRIKASELEKRLALLQYR
ncbi:MAG: ATP-dependent Clp protease proteolytic subunit, partial [Oscillospiraceae bacterium]|nr:ATP-dependent Clp protease proteolytic subunit [Oscillospiraceae bacterium]